MRPVLLLFLFLSTALISACNKADPQKKEPSTSPALREISGDAFIVTRSRENVKLGLVLVSAYPESLILKHLEKKRDEEATRGEQIHPEIERAQRRYDSAVAERSAAVRAWDALPWPKNNQDTEGFAARERAQQRIRSAEGEMSAAQSALSAAQTQFASLSSSSFRFDGLPVAKWSAKTDADGKFLLTVPDKVPIVLVAFTRREMLGSTEEYYWMIRLPEENRQRIFLSNDNLVGTGAMESLL